MGIIWNCIMPLLSTLAALVILVHSAEEDFEMRRHGIQARNAHDNTNSDEPWRVLGLMETDTEGYPNDSHSPRNMEQDRYAEIKEPPRRRKPKRRPQLGIGPRSEKMRPHHPYEESHETEVEYQQPRHTITEDNADEPLQPKKRRRKRPEMILGPDRPPTRLKRRRGHKRKQVVSELTKTMQESNEDNAEHSVFNKQELIQDNSYQNPAERYKKEGITIDESEYNYMKEKNNPIVENAEFYNNRYSEGGVKGYKRKKQSQLENFNTSTERLSEYQSVLTHQTVKDDTDKVITEKDFQIQSVFAQIPNSEEYSLNTNIGYAGGFTVSETAQPSSNELQPTASNANTNPIDTKESVETHDILVNQPTFSEFDMKIPQPQYKERTEQDSDKERNKLNEQSNKVDPENQIDLKDILRRSNGTSLSELLQKHNLSLSDLLKGGSDVLSILNQRISSEESTDKLDSGEYTNDSKVIMHITEIKSKHDEHKVAEVLPLETTTIIYTNVTEEIQPNTESSIETETKAPPRLLNPVARRKLRFRIPKKNNTVRFQASRDFISLDARRAALQNLNFRKNKTENTQETQENMKPVLNENKSLEPEELTSGLKIIIDRNEESKESTLTDNVPTTTISFNESGELSTTLSSFNETEILPTTFPLEDLITESTFTIPATTNKPAPVPIVRPRNQHNPEYRRQALTNRLKRKRLKQKTTSQSPIDDISEEFYSNSNLVSASELITQSVPSPTTSTSHTTFDEIMMTESSVATERSERRRTSTTRKVVRTSTSAPPLFSTTGEIAKLEIQEILNDTNTGRRLSKILMERNMTFNELLQHRERGSSQVHLADIFVNASRDPNPTEPFLSKSSIEPISKETYPLRAILEANLHETTIKSSSEPYTHATPTNIPVVMDFGNNVNENAENLGIMSIFNKVISNENTDELPFLRARRPESTLKTDARKQTEFPTSKEVTLNEIFSMMQRSFKNATDELSESFTKALSPNSTQQNTEKSREDEDIVITEDLQNLGDSDSRMSISNDDLEVTVFERRNEIAGQTVFDKLPGTTKSVTVVTASILGLAMVLFLLTYAMFKWKQQRNQLKNKDCLEENIPTPVFENRKSKKNCSVRSISPMLSSSNIYSLNTLDSQNDKDSHDYVMWDTHRTPFQ